VSGVDSFIEFSVVTSEGAFIKVNSHSNPLLFWALRGGGGGTYGIVTEVTYRTHGPTTVVAQVMVATSTNPVTYAKLITEFIRISPSLSDTGWSGYNSFILPGTFSTLTIAPNVTWAQANATWDPFFSFANNLTSEGLEITTAFTLPFDSWCAWYKELLPPFLTGSNYDLASRLFPKDTVLQDWEKIGSTLATINTGYLSVFRRNVLTVDIG
jgi:hypothetical protein